MAMYRTISAPLIITHRKKKMKQANNGGPGRANKGMIYTIGACNCLGASGKALGTCQGQGGPHAGPCIVHKPGERNRDPATIQEST